MNEYEHKYGVKEALTENMEVKQNPEKDERARHVDRVGSGLSRCEQQNMWWPRGSTHLVPLEEVQ
jgi:hypothetical protein